MARAHSSLTSQEDTEAEDRSAPTIDHPFPRCPEPIYVRADGSVAEGNRRIVVLRAALAEFPHDARFAKMPLGSSQEHNGHVIQDLLNEVHLGSVRGGQTNTHCK